MKGDWRDLTTKCNLQSWPGSYGENATKKQMLLLGQTDKTGIGAID